MDAQNLQAISPFVTPVWETVVNTFIGPWLEKVKNERRLANSLEEHALYNSFSDYLERSYKKHSYVTTVVFQNQQKYIYDLYIPLTIEDSQNNIETIDESEAQPNRYRVDHYNKDFINRFQRILITDVAGMGKSTVLKVLFLRCMEQNAAIPILVELRHLKSEFGVLNNILNQLNSINEVANEAMVLELIQQGEFVFFLDGFDEISSTEADDVVKDIREFIDKAHNSSFVMASRPENALAAFSGFKGFNICPIDRDEANELILKYGQGNQVALALIEKLQDPQYERIHEFLSNPLLVSLLYRSYEYKATIPLKKHVFYRQVYDSLYEEHDITKDAGYRRAKKCSLDIDDFHKVLRSLGFHTSKENRIEYDKDSILNALEVVSQRLPGISFDKHDFLVDLLTTVPLFTRDGQYFRWSHKSLQDYFAASYICFDTKGDQDSILEAISFDVKKLEKYYNVMDLCYDIDYASFRNSVLYKLAKRYLAFYNSTFQDRPDLEPLSDEVTQRKEVMFANSFCLIPASIYDHHFPEDNRSRNVEELVSLLRAAMPVFNDSPSWITGHGEGSVAIAGTDVPLTGLLTLLVAKQNPLVKAKFRQDKPAEANVDWINQLTTLNDDPENEANKPAYFSSVNSYLVSRVRVLAMDTKQCIKLVEEVERLSERKPIEYFLEGL